LLRGTGFFREEEILVALEVFDDALHPHGTSAYQSFVLAEGDAVLGWICWGATPGTRGTYDIYWLAVENHHHKMGYGSLLLHFAEENIREAGGHLICIETSGSNQYRPTCQFYLRRGYRKTARINNFYAPGDAKVIYTKEIARDGYTELAS